MKVEPAIQKFKRLNKGLKEVNQIDPCFSDNCEYNEVCKPGTNFVCPDEKEKKDEEENGLEEEAN